MGDSGQPWTLNRPCRRLARGPETLHTGRLPAISGRAPNTVECTRSESCRLLLEVRCIQSLGYWRSAAKRAPVGCQAGVRNFWSSKIACWELTSSCRPHPVGVYNVGAFVLFDTVVYARRRPAVCLPGIDPVVLPCLQYEAVNITGSWPSSLPGCKWRDSGIGWWLGTIRPWSLSTVSPCNWDH